MIKDSNNVAIIAGERSVTFSELLQKVSLYAEKTPHKKGERTIIFAENSEGWVYAFYSIWANGGIAVPVDASATVSDLSYVIKDCKPTCVWTSRKKQSVVYSAIKEVGSKIDICFIEDYEKVHTDLPKAEVKYRPDDTAVIIYTSGTTGSPKGVMLSFLNIMVNINAVYREVPIFREDLRTLILLPLHHVLPLVGTVVMPMYVGCGVAICPSMAAADIMETLQRGRVGLMVGVPRLWQTLYNGIKRKIEASPITRALFKLCASVGNASFSRFVFQAVHKKMGGNVRFFVSGGAALDKDTALGLRALGFELIEGYGMTEAAPMIAFTRPGDFVPNCVGLPLNAMECKIIDGEICAKGPNVMQGYYNRPEETAAVIDKDGFLHTGDLGRLDEKGRIHILGRSKEIIVLSNGKNVQPNEIEHKLELFDKYVKEAAVVQDGDMLKAIIVPEPNWAKSITDNEVEEILKREVLEPYNLTVTNYKKIMSLFVYRDELPRTKLEKLQRFKLKDIISGAATDTKAAAVIVDEPDFEEYKIIKKYVESEKKVKLRPTDHIETDLAFNSLDMLAFEDFIQQTFGTRVVSATMPSYKNIQELAEYVAGSKTRMEVEDVDWKKFLHSSSSNVELPKCGLRLKMFSVFFSVWYKLYHRLSVKGLENIPTEGPFIISPNHQSYLDGSLVAASMSLTVLKNSYFYAHEKHFKSAFRKSMASHCNIILMDQSDLKTSLLQLAEVLRQGKNVVIFPEGARTRDGKVSEFKKTFAILAKEMQVPVVPLCIKGAYEALPKSSWFIRPTKIELEYLAPVVPNCESSYDGLSEQVKNIITEKLSEK